MKRIKDFSHVIGVIGRGGRFFASNDLSEHKLHAVLEAAGVPKPFASTFDSKELSLLTQVAKAAGFKILVIERGLNR